METAKQVRCSHNWKFENDQFTRDADGWLHGVAECTQCQDRTYLWFYPRGGQQHPMADIWPRDNAGIVITSKDLKTKGKCNNGARD